MTTQQPSAINRLAILKTAAALPAVYFTLCYCVMVFQRLFYPFELEWLEGYFIAGMQRVATGRSVYPAPNHEFVPFLYPPLYYWVTGLLAKLLGSGFFVARLVSVISSLVSGCIIYRFVFRETASGFAGLVSAGLFYACYGVSDFWYDVGRVDSLFLALSLAGLYLARYHARSSAGAAVSALVLCLAYFTKQSAVFFIIACALFVWGAGKRQFFIYAGTSLVCVVGGNLLMNRATGGWYWFYSFLVPLKHYGYKALAHDTSLSEIYRQYTHLALQDYGSLKKFYCFFTVDLLGNIPVIVTVIIAWLLCPTQLRGKRAATFFLILAMAGALLASISMRCKFGGHINGIIPAIAVMILFFGIIAGHILKKGNHTILLACLLYSAIAVQFVLLRYNPLHHVPTEHDRAAGQAVIKTISDFPGDVYMPFHSWYPAMAGKPVFVHKMPVEDVFIGFPDTYPRSLVEKIAQQEFSAIIYDWEIRPETRNPIEGEIIRSYRKKGTIAYAGPAVFLPATGFKIRPGIIYVPATGQ